MKLYDVIQAPNPRRVRVFLAEKGITVPMVQVDMAKGEHKSAAFLRKNGSGKVPVLELDDGTCIGESVAICRYFEALHPEPSLFGRTPAELGRIEMRNRQLEFELLGPIGVSWRNGPVVTRMFKIEGIAAAKVQSDAATNAFYARLNDELADQPFMAGEQYSIADVTALGVIDFATKLVELKPDAALTNLWRWHAAVSARPSAAA